MQQECAQVMIPKDLLADIDALVGQQNRNDFLVGALRIEIDRRRRLLRLLSRPEPIWKDEDHPELREGADVWVRRMRDEDLRLEQEKLGDWLPKAE